MSINGRPLVVQLTADLSQLCERVVLVVAPENAERIRDELKASELLTSKVRLVIQPFPRGPGDALLRALEATQGSRVLMVCGDNVIPGEDLLKFTDRSQRATTFAVGTLNVDAFEAPERYTRYDGKKWYEGPLHDAPYEGDLYKVWLGPVIVPRIMEGMLRNATLRSAGSQDILIGPHFNDLGMKPVLIPCEVRDIGTPASLKEAQA